MTFWNEILSEKNPLGAKVTTKYIEREIHSKKSDFAFCEQKQIETLGYFQEIKLYLMYNR